MSSPGQPRRLRLVAYTDADGFGGAEDVLGFVLERLPDDFDVTVMGVDRGVVDRLAANRPGSGTVVVPPVRTKRDLGPIRSHLRAMRSLSPDVCHVNLRTPYAAQYGTLAALLTPGARVVVVEHSILASDSGFRRWLKRLTSARVDAHVGVGDRASRLIESDAGLPAGSIRVIYNGVPGQPGDEVPVRLADELVFGTIGRVDNLKGLDILIDALARIPEARVAIVGKGPELPALEAHARMREVADRVIFTGWRDEGLQLVAGFDVFVLPSLLEGFPLSVLEAMHRGRPVVATAVGSVSEMVVDGETGLIVPPGDPSALTDALERLRTDPALRKRLGLAGRARARALFDVETMAQAYERLYREVCA